jgi:hypothetical protein
MFLLLDNRMKMNEIYKKNVVIQKSYISSICMIFYFIFYFIVFLEREFYSGRS